MCNMARPVLHRAVTLTADQIATSWKGSEEPGWPRAPFPAYCLRHTFPDNTVLLETRDTQRRGVVSIRDV